jgi:hypothetical protein
LLTCTDASSTSSGRRPDPKDSVARSGQGGLTLQQVPLEEASEDLGKVRRRDVVSITDALAELERLVHGYSPWDFGPYLVTELLVDLRADCLRNADPAVEAGQDNPGPPQRMRSLDPLHTSPRKKYLTCLHMFKARLASLIRHARRALKASR